MDPGMRLSQLTDEQLDRLVGIHAGLSPENLTGDGELPQSVWMAKQRELERQLVSLIAELGIAQDDSDEASVFAELARRQEDRRGSRPRLRR